MWAALSARNGPVVVTARPRVIDFGVIFRFPLHQGKLPSPFRAARPQRKSLNIKTPLLDTLEKAMPQSSNDFRERWSEFAAKELN
jgi:hypothetical protein